LPLFLLLFSIVIPDLHFFFLFFVCAWRILLATSAAFYSILSRSLEKHGAGTAAATASIRIYIYYEHGTLRQPNESFPGCA
jgi:hypothetical protein